MLDLACSYQDLRKTGGASTILSIDSFMVIQGSHRGSMAGITRSYAWRCPVEGIMSLGENSYAALTGEVERTEPDLTLFPGDTLATEPVNILFKSGDTLMIYLPGYPVSQLEAMYQDALKSTGYQGEMLDRPCIANLRSPYEFYSLQS